MPLKWMLCFAFPAILSAGEAPGTLEARRSAELDDLGPILTESLRDSLLATESLWELEAWLETFWAARDLSPETPRNERRDEHTRRLAFARKNYPAPAPPYYDERGRAHILFGPPDEVLERDVSVDSFYHPRRLAWIWREPDMMEEYWDFDLDGIYALAGADPAATNMARQGSRNLGSMHSDSPFFSDPFDDLSAIDRKGALAESRERGIGRYREDARSVPLTGWFEVNRYRGEEGRVRVEIPWQLIGEDLSFAGEPPLAEVRERLILISAEGRLLEREPRILRMPVAAGELVALPTLSLDPGDWNLVLRLEDRAAGRNVSYETLVQVREFPEGAFALSDLAFSSSIEERTLPGRFVKGDWKVDPNPRALFRDRESIRAFFEIYGLALDAEGRSRYRVRSRILPAGGAEAVRADLASEHREHGEQAIFTLTIGSRDLARGDYQLEVEVADLLSGASASRRKTFRLD